MNLIITFLAGSSIGLILQHFKNKELKKELLKQQKFRKQISKLMEVEYEKKQNDHFR